MKLNGKPFVGYLQLTNAASAMAAIPIYVAGKAAAYTLAASEQQVLTSIVVSSNDTATPLTQVDNGVGGTVHIFGSYYAGIAAGAQTTVTDYIGSQPGATGTAGVAIRAGTPGGITAAKTVEVTIRGFITQS